MVNSENAIQAAAADFRNCIRSNAEAQAEAQHAVAALPLVPPDLWAKVRPTTTGVILGPNGTAVKQLTGSKLGSRAGATDEILLAIVGYRVSRTSLKILADTAGKYNPLHTAERVKGVEQGGASVLGRQGGHCIFGIAPDGTVGINPLWYAWKTGNGVSAGTAQIGKPVSAPIDTAAANAAAANAGEKASADYVAEATGRGLGKAARKAKRAQTAKQLEASLEPTPTDLSVGGLLKASLALAAGSKGKSKGKGKGKPTAE